MLYCRQCGRQLRGDEVGLHRKLINKMDDSFLCKTCISAYFRISEAKCDELIEHYKKTGCHLFK